MSNNYTIQPMPAGAEQTQVNRFVMSWEYHLIPFLDLANINWSWYEGYEDGGQLDYPNVEIIFASDTPEIWVGYLLDHYAAYKQDQQTHGEGEE